MRGLFQNVDRIYIVLIISLQKVHKNTHGQLELLTIVHVYFVPELMGTVTLLNLICLLLDFLIKSLTVTVHQQRKI